MSLHVLSGQLTFRPEADGQSVHAEVEIRFAKPVRQVVAVLSGFDISASDGEALPVAALQLSLGATQQQVPSKTAQIHGRLAGRDGGGLQGTIHFTALGFE